MKDFIRTVVEDFPTNSKKLLDKKSYFWVVYFHLLKSKSFLEIGYRKGLFVEVCKTLNMDSIHIDITDKLLRATPTDNNQCFTIDSVVYLKQCTRSFDLIFQDGSKTYTDRSTEYDLIMDNSLLQSNGVIIADDLHYPDCQRAFDRAVSDYGFEHSYVNVKDKKVYRMGIIRWTG